MASFGYRQPGFLAQLRFVLSASSQSCLLSCCDFNLVVACFNNNLKFIITTCNTDDKPLTHLATIIICLFLKIDFRVEMQSSDLTEDLMTLYANQFLLSF